MRKRLLLGTTNPEKVLILRGSLAPLPLDLVELADLGIEIDVEENGTTLEENAAAKAKAYFGASRLPTLAIDGGLHIEGLPDERQPGVLVRRIPGVEETTDADVLAHYERELEKLGGEARATLSGAMALAITGDKVVTERFSIKMLMRTERQGRPTPGAPLNCLMIDPVSGKYYSEMRREERPDFDKYREFVADYIDEL